jgi:hypothetical protein
VSGALLGALPTPEASAAQVRRIVEEVLREERFADAQPSWLQQAYAWVMDRVLGFVSLLASGAPGQIASAVAFVVVVATVVVLAALYLRRIRRSGGRHAVAHDRTPVRTAVQWRELADDAQGDGDLREAVRCHYRALVADFAAAGWLEEIPGRTSGQYLAAVRHDLPAAADDFAEATTLFDRVWYGHLTPSAADVERIGRLSGDVVARVRRRLVPA